MLFNRERLEQNEAQTLAPYASLAKNSRGRVYPEDESKFRTAYQKDRDRIIHTSAFRRLEYKTQVFVNYEGDYYRTRLTHTLEVAQVSKSIARALGLNEDLTENIALAHDLGHPPYGHAGERTLNMLAKDAGGFDHNKQSLRVVTSIEQRYPEYPGLNLSWETLEGIMKHETDYEVPDTNWEPDKQPSLEAQVVHIADEMTYDTHDLDDGLSSGYLSAKQIVTVPLIAELMDNLEIKAENFSHRHQSLLIRELLGKIIEDAIQNTHQNLESHHIKSVADVRNQNFTLVAMSKDTKTKLQDLQAFLYENFYFHYRLIRMTKKAEMVLERIFKAYMETPKMLPKGVLSAAEKRGLMRAVTDYIATMTDRYASNEYSRLFDPFTLT
ncbi:MAG: deoxyguanosinetriphosphate triphosphohydrolase [Trueperaceae bacterium]|nr:deoxyguanosinetriphosphate triphosphohydrolase [Trueperaceae bacterium]